MVIDIGNTRIKSGIFQDDVLQEHFSTYSFPPDKVLALATSHRVDRIIISSVAAPDPDFISYLSKQISLTEFTHHTPLPFQNGYSTPDTLGKDRLAAVAGAHALFPGIDCLVIDGGTCLKYEVLRADGMYLGGNIAPGLRMRTQAMQHFTARLPEVETAIPEMVIGNSTTTALQNGAFRGILYEIEGFYAAIEKISGTGLQVIFTGGDAPFLANHLHFENAISEPHLTLIGLNEILRNISNDEFIR